VVVDRPSWTEVVGVLCVCALLFVVIAKLDHAAAQRAADRARTAQVDAAPAKAAKPSRPTSTGVALAGGGVAEAPSREGRASGRAAHTGSVALFLVAALGAVMAATGAALLNRR
jgi:hypothetical protein